MVKETFFFLLVIIILLCHSSLLLAQGGGPPMLTTDPNTPGMNNWEINSSLNFHSSVLSDMQIPATEIVYGLGHHYQISVQLPLPDVELNNSHFTTTTQPQMGIKCQVLNEDINFISIAVYPQIIIPLHKEQTTQVFIPIEFEKTFHNFRIGEEFGCFVLNNPNSIFSGTLVGYQFNDDLEVMGEFFLSQITNKSHSTTGLLNFGFRKPLTKYFTLLSSLGTQIMAPDDEDTQHLFGLLGIQVSIGEE